MSSNRLKNTSSLYLLQHANQPVHWYTWGSEAFSAAKEENKPILLSIGYAACHWCHVMAHESFENEEIAAYLNSHFISIKVDREERPDVDEIYMTVVQALNRGNGGWPMTVILTPEAEPIFGGTYFPPTPRSGMPGLNQILQHSHDLYHKAPEKKERLIKQLTNYLKQATTLPVPADNIGVDWFQRITESATKDYDHRYGGFGHAPKFPPHGLLASLLAYAELTQDDGIQELAMGTLKGMARGGVYDLIGGGFARYSVDEQWRIPHFEKMLSDNAQLIPRYLEAYTMTGDPHYKEVARSCLDQAVRELMLVDGGFASSLDADSEGEEGRFYCWSREEAREILGVDSEAVLDLLEITEDGTFEENGWSVPRLETPLCHQPDSTRTLLQRALVKLREKRSERTPPARDDKLVCSWNAMMVSAFAKAGRLLQDPEYTKIALKTLSVIKSKLFHNGRLLRCPMNNGAPLLGFADDYAALINALLDVVETEFSLKEVKFAESLMTQFIDLFWDKNSPEGGFYYTGSDAPPLIVRSKKATGGAEPSANALGALALIRLDVLFERGTYTKMAEQILCCYQTLAERAPQAIGWEAYAAGWLKYPIQEIIIIQNDTDQNELQKMVAQTPYPFRTCLTLTEEQAVNAESEIPVFMNRRQKDEKPTAYFCENRQCQPPVTEPEELKKQIDNAKCQAHAQLLEVLRGDAPNLPNVQERWINGTASGYDNRITIIDFWTSGSINCHHLIPEVQKVKNRFSKQAVQFIGVHSSKFSREKHIETVKHAVNRHRIVHPVLLDADHEVWDAFEIKAWPTVIIVDKNGKIAYRRSGEITAEELVAVCERLMKEIEGPQMVLTTTGPDLSNQETNLYYPTKVCVYPSITKQLQGEDAFAIGSRLYVADTGHNQIKVYHLSKDDSGWPNAVHVDTWGTGEADLVDGPVKGAAFNQPHGLTATKDTLYVADTGNHAIRAIDLKSLKVKTLAGTGSLGRGSISENSNPLEQNLRSPIDLDVIHQSSSELLIIAMAGAHQLWLYVPDTDRIGPFLGSGVESHVDGNATDSALAQPSSVVSVGPYLFFVDSETSSVRLYDFEARQVGTLVGEGLFDFGDIDGSSDLVRLQHPMGLTAGRTRVFVADTYNDKIKSIDLNGAFTRTVYGQEPGLLDEPRGLTRADKYLIIADTNNHRIVCVDVELGTGGILIR